MIDVIIPQFNQSAHTVRCLRSIGAHAPTARVILVDNGSDPTEFHAAYSALRDMPHAVVRNAENRGFVAATNQGLEVATADFVVLQNNDTEIFAGCYDSFEAVMRANPQAGAVGPISSPCGSWQSLDRVARMWPQHLCAPELMSASHEERAALLRRSAAGEVRRIPTMLAFFCVMLPRRVLQTVGLLSTDYGHGLGDDDDYCARIRAHGFELILDLSTYVFHNHRTTWKALYSEDEIKELQKRNVRLFLDKHRGGRRDARGGAGARELREVR